MKRSILFFISLLPLYSIAQTIPAASRVDWSKAGLEGEVPQLSNVADVTAFGAVANDTIDDYPAIQTAMTSLNGGSGVIYFPAGNYLVRSTISLDADSLIIRGAGSDSTILSFNFNGSAANSFHIGHALNDTFHSLSSGYLKDSRKLIAANAQQFFAAGERVEIREENGTWDIQPISWADHSVGHFSKIDSVNTDTIWLNEALRLDFDSVLHPEIRRAIPRQYCGLECFKMVRIDTNSNGTSYGCDFSNASNCWMRGVESERSICAHVSIDRSSHISITGCYFHDAHLYDGTSTRGYGVLLITHSTSNLIEDNIFKHLRHAMIAKQGANGNVFGYNYSIEPNRSEPIPDYAADLCLHGHYAFANLFEGNIAQNLQIDIVWGPSGPYNTFFRNKVELYGIIMSSGSVQSNGQNFVGNDVSSSQFLQGNYSLTGTGHFQYGNMVQATLTPANTNGLMDTSCYLSSIPPFFWNIPKHLPAVGRPNAFADDNNPAHQRYLDGGVLTRCEYVPYVDTTVSTFLFSPAISVFEIQNCIAERNRLTLTLSCSKNIEIRMELLSVTGQQLVGQKIKPGEGVSTQALPIPDVPAGVYLLRINANGESLTRKIVLAE